MLKKENPRSKMRCELLKKCSEMGLSSHTEAEMTECMDGKTDAEKEKLAEQLLKIISTSATEEEMIAKSVKLRKNILDRAIVFATEAHKGQYRKGTYIPYILHPMEAATIVGTMTTDNEVIAGAVLHDVIEDTNTTLEQVQELFGERVAKFVAAESENKRENLSAESTWKIRKQETLEHLKTASNEVKMITLGDKLSNIRAINRDYNKIGDKLWQRFNQKDKKEHYWYYQGIADCLLELDEYPAYKEYCELVKKIFIS